MKNDSQHPGRSVAFLSRLHDGELSPAERARFESHRAHCSECRRSAREFEESLSLFRSARSRPPNADLAARILRKVQAGPRRPAPFGVFFGIDPRWAAAAATVVFGLFLGYAALDSGRESPRILPVSLVTPSSEDSSSQDAPVAVRVPERESAPPANAAKSTASDPRRLRRSSTDRVLPESGEIDRKEAAAEAVVEQAPPPVAVPAEAPLSDSSRSVDRIGGDDDVAARAPLPVVRKAPRMVIEAIDGYGPAPALLSEARLEIPAGGREHRYVLLVDSQGTVTRVSPEARRDDALEARGAPASGARMARPEAAAPAGISDLKFKPGNRPRRLRVRFE